MHPADKVTMEWRLTAAAVAGCLAHAARQRGGTLMGSAAELHKLGSGPLWPRSALELERVQLPDLARRPGHAGCTVRPVGGAARGVWHVTAAALPKPAAMPAAQPIAPALAARPQAAAPPIAAAPTMATQRRPAAAAPTLTEAEYERVRKLAAAERQQQKWEAINRGIQAERVKEHAANLAFLASANRRAVA